MTLPTPAYDPSSLTNVYEPSEDTFLLLDALEYEMQFLREFDPLLCVEIGSGSGVVSAALKSIVPRATVFTTDINHNACLATQRTALLNSVQLETCTMELLSSFRCRFDVVVFNPPYVPTDEEEVFGRGINKAWAGGERGCTVIDALLRDIMRLLADRCVLYLLLLRENGVNSIREKLAANGLQSNVVNERRILGEYLYVIKFFK